MSKKENVPCGNKNPKVQRKDLKSIIDYIFDHYPSDKTKQVSLYVACDNLVKVFGQVFQGDANAQKIFNSNSNDHYLGE